MAIQRTALFKDSWAHKGQWPTCYSYPSWMAGYSSPQAYLKEHGDQAAYKAYWQEVADEIQHHLLMAFTIQ